MESTPLRHLHSMPPSCQEKGAKSGIIPLEGNWLVAKYGHKNPCKKTIRDVYGTQGGKQLMARRIFVDGTPFHTRSKVTYVKWDGGGLVGYFRGLEYI